VKSLKIKFRNIQETKSELKFEYEEKSTREKGEQSR
jgi:hypothetical protein